MQNSYSKSSRQVLEIAQEQAKEFHHRLVGTEHVLLALVIEADGKAGQDPADHERDADRSQGRNRALHGLRSAAP